MAIDPQTHTTRPPPKPAAEANAPQPPPSPSQRFFRPISHPPAPATATASVPAPAPAPAPAPPHRSWQSKAAVLKAELLSKNCKRMGCQLLCFRMLPPACFEIDQAQTAILFPDGRLRRDDDPTAPVPAPALRFNLPLFCIECGVYSGFYGPGDQIRTREHEELWMCACGHLRRKTDRYESRVCTGCGDTCLSSAVSSRRKRRSAMIPPESM
ncbi:hypothetical protein ACRALDRAFT_1082153 [Sodiomyces alcalophilus JCM 7366]|uniref:uncharacterized protein n=1 Tax=Sodiomyces alcalophilus JCM 7366 TaxID=591952 RepID=UPI0039B56017